MKLNKIKTIIDNKIRTILNNRKLIWKALIPFFILPILASIFYLFIKQIIWLNITMIFMSILYTWIFILRNYKDKMFSEEISKNNEKKIKIKSLRQRSKRLLKRIK